MSTKKIIAAFLGTVAFLSNLPLLAEDAYITQFSVTEGKPVDKGVVFIDGQYIESPYIVSRKGLTLYINERKIERPTRHVETPIIPGYENPDRISAAERDKLFRALEATRNIYEKYLGRNCGYLFSGKGGHLKLSTHTVAYDMPVVIECLTSVKPRDEKLEELRPHNWHLHIDIDTFIDNFRITDQLMPRLEQLAEELLKVEEYGLMSEAPVSQGFLFINGKYIEAPYQVERKGLGVFINGIMIQRPYDMPRKKYSGDIDPVLPPEINEETSIFDEIVSTYISQKHAFLRKHNIAEEEQIEIMEQVYKSLPFITEAKRDEKAPHALHIETNEGVSFNQSLLSMVGRRGVKFDKISVTKRIDSSRDYFQKALEKGACYFLRKNGGRTRLSTGSVPEKLPRMINILRSRHTTNQKLQEIRKAGINISEETVRELITNFSASSQLEARLSKLAKPK